MDERQGKTTEQAFVLAGAMGMTAGNPQASIVGRKQATQAKHPLDKAACITLTGTMKPPEPLPENLLGAVAPWVLEHGLRPRDFSRHYEGYLTVEEISQFDDLSWMQVRTPGDLRSFRGGAFRGEAREMPPIIVVTAPKVGVCYTQIGDGRGRVNFAKAHNVRLHVWHLVHKDCSGERGTERL